MAFDAIYLGSNPSAPTRSFGRRPTVGRESLTLEIGVRVPPPDPFNGDKAQGGPRVSGTRAGGFDPRVSDHGRRVQLVKPVVLQTAFAGFDPLASYRSADGRLP